MAVQLGYCTNVHAGPDLARTRANLEQYALEVKRRFSPKQPMGVGLWLAASAARQLRQENKVADFAAWLKEVGLLPFTLNGFPYGDFHQDVVKHDVYLPTWAEPARLEYTRDLIVILDQLLPAGVPGSISTLPIIWGRPPPTREHVQQAASALARIAEELAILERERGRKITLCIEPEPGCFLQYSDEVVRFFEEDLLPGRAEQSIRRHLCVCHDVCHAAVMFEEQAAVLNRYRAAGIGVGKVQVSSAVAMPLQEIPAQDHAAAVAQLAGFHEPRYLHQTMVRSSPDMAPEFYEDLHHALAAHRGKERGEWRVHFHVPIYLEQFGHLRAMQSAIHDCLRALKKQDGVEHFEVETYAWGVLPPELRQANLAAGIAEEMRWFAGIIAKQHSAV